MPFGVARLVLIGLGDAISSSRPDLHFSHTYRETARSVQGQDGRRKTWLARESGRFFYGYATLA